MAAVLNLTGSLPQLYYCPSKINLPHQVSLPATSSLVIDINQPLQQWFHRRIVARPAVVLQLMIENTHQTNTFSWDGGQPLTALLNHPFIESQFLIEPKDKAMIEPLDFFKI